MVEKKKRVRIPDDVATDVLIAHDFICCVCNVPGKKVQIHHIDEDPSNNSPENLSALCFEDHDRTMTSGGFGRQLNASAVTKYRNNWVVRIQKRRDDTDALFVNARARHSVDASKDGNEVSVHPNEPSNEEFEKLRLWASGNTKREKLLEMPNTYLEAVEIHNEGYGGSTLDMMGSAYGEIDILTNIWADLLGYMPSLDIGQQSTGEYISSFTQQRFAWHRALSEPNGPGTGGTMVGPVASGGVIADLEEAISETGYAIFFGDEWELADAWVILWKAARKRRREMM